MPTLLRILALCASLASISAGFAQDSIMVSTGTAIETARHTVTLGYPVVSARGFPAGWNLSRVLPGSTVRIELAAQFDGATDIKWHLPQDATRSTGATRFIEIERFNSSHDGSYSASFRLNGRGEFSAEYELKSTPFATAAFKNISSRTRLSPDNPQLIAGFVVGREGVVSGMTRLVVVRAVGPSLANFGGTAALADPQVQVFDAEGTIVTPIPRWNASTGDILIGWQTYEDYLRSVLLSLGAFPTPILDPATDGPPSEPVREYELAPGSYTAVATSVGNASGDVLLEVYEFKGINPADYFGWPTVMEPTQSDPPGS
jgi:hypothetical protein